MPRTLIDTALDTAAITAIASAQIDILRIAKALKWRRAKEHNAFCPQLRRDMYQSTLYIDMQQGFFQYIFYELQTFP